MSKYKHPAVQKYIANAITELITNGFSVRMENSQKVDNCGGYVNDTPKEFVVATKGSFVTTFGIFIHEYCHFLQWMDKDSIWHNDNGTVNDFFYWLDGSSQKINAKIIHGVQLLELDCERRAIDEILKNDLPLNVPRYCKGTNSYLWLYPVLRRTRKWVKKSPYRVKEIINLVPDTLLHPKEYKTPPKKYVELVLDKCF